MPKQEGSKVRKAERREEADIKAYIKTLRYALFTMGKKISKYLRTDSSILVYHFIQHV